MGNLTILYYTSNLVPEPCATLVRQQIVAATPDVPIVSVSQRPLDFGRNFCVGEIGASGWNLYRQLHIAAEAAKTEFVACCEDDVLYPPSHFLARPTDFGYNMNRWQLFTWEKRPIFSHKENRCCLHNLICPRQLLVECLRERFSRTHSPEVVAEHFGEPGRWIHEKFLGVTQRPLSIFRSPEPTVVFIHAKSLYCVEHGAWKGHGNDGREKSLAPWGSASDVLSKFFGQRWWESEWPDAGPKRHHPREKRGVPGPYSAGHLEQPAG